MIVPAVKACMRSMHFAPMPADIRAKMYEINTDPEDTPERAWEIYYKTVCRVGSFNSAREAWESLPEKIRNITRPDEMKTFAFTSTQAEYSYVRSAFLKAYAQQIEAEKNAVIEGRLQLTELMQNVPQLEEK